MNQIHWKECYNFFSEIKGGGNLYLRIEREFDENTLGSDSIENNQCIQVSVINDDILQYDLENFNIEIRNDLLTDYRPYFVSFIIPDDSFRDVFSQIEFLGDRWYQGKFLPLYDSSEEEGTVFEGYLITSASPINYIKGRLLIFTNQTLSKPVLEKINNTYNTQKFISSNNNQVEQVLLEAWGNDCPKTIDIYNVGHGNADYIRGERHRILYDVGYDYLRVPSRYNSLYPRAVNAIRHLKPSCVVLSHWHLDHIIGCAYAEQSLFDVNWIAPNLVSDKSKKPSINAVRLANYLFSLGKLYLVDRSQGNQRIASVICRKNVVINLWLGGGNSVLSPNNREGLMLEIVNNEKNDRHILLAGDVPYQCMQNMSLNQVDYLHVPHHCSDMELSMLNNVNNVQRGKWAIITTNRSKKGNIVYNCAHHKTLGKKFCNVMQTIDNPAGRDWANLSVQVDYDTGTVRPR